MQALQRFEELVERVMEGSFARLFRSPIQPAEIAKRLRKQHAGTVFVAGLFIAAFVSIPILNLATPLFATAFMVHVHKQIARRASLPFRGGSRA